MINIISLLMLTILSYSSLYAEEESRSISTKTAVIFNILCAKCHEGECSGRLSFKNTHTAADSHITRYSEDANITENEIGEFFTLLNYMKTDCAMLMPKNNTDPKRDLSRFALNSNKGYFIPLGNLEAGRYLLGFTPEEHVSFRLEVMSKHFEPFLDQSVCRHQKEYLFSFTVDKRVPVFLRIRSRTPLHLSALELKKI
ncbi:MAG: hypothetical protein B5M52_02910 [Helicobacteraceae bacterium 4484_230]|nr:MAG: hypothetical protein B5M52_02910 [Helicobacteraceae bacterium 4484_230]